MDLSKRDKDRLRKLAELYEREDLSDEEYRHQYSKIVRDNRGTSELDKLASDNKTLPEDVAIVNENAFEQTLQDIENGKTQELEEKSLLKEMLERSERETRDVEENSELLQIARGSQAETTEVSASLPIAPKGVGGFGSSRERHDSNILPPSLGNRANKRGSRSRYSKVGGRAKHFRGRGVGIAKLLIVFAVFALGIIVALAIARTIIVEPKEANPKPTSPSAETAQVPSELFIKPLFGDLAVQRCSTRCANSNWKDKAATTACNRGCERLSLKSYGRRITLKPLDAKEDADRIVFDCLRQPIRVSRFSTTEEWRAHVSQSINVLFQYGASTSSIDELATANLYYEKIKSSHERLKLPPMSAVENDPITEHMIRVGCLRTQLALTEVARGVVRERSDEFSWEFYNKLYQALKPRVIDAESKLESNVVGLGLR